MKLYKLDSAKTSDDGTIELDDETIAHGDEARLAITGGTHASM